jgi:hypothetical protein
MYKRILFTLITLNCAVTQAEVAESLREQIARKETELDELKCLQNVEEMELYKISLISAYQQALVDELSGKNKAIEQKFSNNTTENNNETTNRKSQECNGYHISDPDTKSRAGRACEEHQKEAYKKNSLNKNYCDLATRKKSIFDSKIVPFLEKSIQRKLDLIDSYVKALEFCGNDGACFNAEGISLEGISEKDFFARFVTTTYNPTMQLLEREEIPVTREQLMVIVASNEKTKKTIKNFEEASEKAKQKVQEVLHPNVAESDQETSIFEKKD